MNKELKKYIIKEIEDISCKMSGNRQLKAYNDDILTDEDRQDLDNLYYTLDAYLEKLYSKLGKIAYDESV